MTPTHCPRCRAARTMRPDMDGAPACVACGYVHVEHIDRTDPADQTHPRHLDARYIREARAHDYTAAPDRGDTYARAQVAQQTRRAEERRQPRPRAPGPRESRIVARRTSAPRGSVARIPKHDHQLQPPPVRQDHRQVDRRLARLPHKLEPKPTAARPARGAWSARDWPPAVDKAGQTEPPAQVPAERSRDIDRTHHRTRPRREIEPKAAEGA